MSSVEAIFTCSVKVTANVWMVTYLRGLRGQDTNLETGMDT